MTPSSIRFKAVRRLASSPLGPYVQPFITQLQQQGYGSTTIRCHLRHIATVKAWLTRTGRDLADLNEELLERFWQRRLRGRRRFGEVLAMQRLLALLRKARVTPPAMAIPRTPAEELALGYRRYLLEDRGCSHATVRSYGGYVDRLVAQRFGEETVSLSRIQAHDVIEYVRRQARTHTPQSTKSLVTALRSFLRFLYFRRIIRTDLASMVPAVACWRMTGLPKHLSVDEVHRVLEQCEQTTPVGQRNYAILLLLARLGLRASEIVALQLEDIDWEHAQITIRSNKGRGWAQMPLPREVGKALARYLRHGRPSCPCRHVFVRSRAPYVPFSTSADIAGLTRSALQKAGVKSARKGAHLFRHGLATAMLRRGATLDEISQVLRHRDPDTTALYAKVDVEALRRLALPWPGGEQ